MSHEAPKLIAIAHDDYHAKYVGHTADGRQFFLTPLFQGKSPTGPGCEFLALFIFDAAGQLLESKIHSFGPRENMENGARAALCDRHLHELGDVSLGRIEIAPFRIEAFGLEFGLIAHPPDEYVHEWCVILSPGNCMAFHAPWDSGEYDT